jgi:hypothetical protein
VAGASEFLAAVSTAGELPLRAVVGFPPWPSAVRYLLPDHLILDFVLRTKLTSSSSRSGGIRVAGEGLRRAEVSLRGSDWEVDDAGASVD